MKKFFLIFVSLFGVMLLTGCKIETSETKDAALVETQQGIYQKTQPVHLYDYSIPRDIYQQIYDITTTEVIATYTVIETVTGATKYEGPSIGFPIPADVSLTNPQQLNLRRFKDSNVSATYVEGTVEQAEPNGLFSSKNTDGTWTLFVEPDGSVFPVYSEHKFTTYPAIMEKDEEGQWHRADNTPIKFKIKIRETI